MHADELPVDVALARALLEDQFPEWADLQLERVASFGTDNALFRLGGDMVGRLPRIEWATRDIEKDARWLEQLRPLLERDAEVRRAIGEVADEFDALAVEAKWDDSLEAAPWDGPPVWTHGDLLRGNLLLREGRLAAVIDWSLLGVGDPACDAIVAWSVLPEETRDAFRAEAGFDDATWARGRGWALCCGLLQVPYYAESN